MGCNFQDQCDYSKDPSIRKRFCAIEKITRGCPYIFEVDESDESDTEPEFDISLLADFQVDNFEGGGNDAVYAEQDDIFNNQDDVFDNQVPSHAASKHISSSQKEIYNKYIYHMKSALKKFGNLVCESIGGGDMPEAAFGYFNAEGRNKRERNIWLFHFWREIKSGGITCVISPGYANFTVNPNNPGDLDFERFCARMDNLPGKNLISTFEEGAAPRGKVNLLDKLVMFSSKLEATAAAGGFRNSAQNSIYENLRILNDYFDYVCCEYINALLCEQERIIMFLMDRFEGRVTSDNCCELTLPHDDSYLELPDYLSDVFELYLLVVKAEQYTNDCTAHYESLALESGESGRNEFMRLINNAILNAWKP